MEVDTPMRFASATKLLTTIMALQCAERGLIDLDENVEKFVPDLTSMKILAGFDDVGKAIMRDRDGIITLRLVHYITSAYQNRQWFADFEKSLFEIKTSLDSYIGSLVCIDQSSPAAVHGQGVPPISRQIRNPEPASTTTRERPRC